jgi:iron(III) transport system ATP-binding protein
MVSRSGESGVIDLGDGRRGEVALLQALSPGDKVHIPLRPENIGIGQQEGSNIFPARVLDRRYQGTQTVYQIDVFARRLEALELGTAARHQVGEACSAYSDAGVSSHD